jgi:hypothetical protein
VGPAVHVTSDFQDSVSLREATAMQGLTLEFAWQPLSRLYGLQWEFKIANVAYTCKRLLLLFLRKNWCSFESPL